jgi:hypothetical protein
VSAETRHLIAAVLTGIWPSGLPLFGENQRLRPTTPDRSNDHPPDNPGNLPAYLQWHLFSADDEAPALLGSVQPQAGLLSLTLTVAHGKGMETADQLTGLLATGLAQQRHGRLQFAEFQIAGGRQIGAFWVINCEVGFTLWPTP